MYLIYFLRRAQLKLEKHQNSENWDVILQGKNLEALHRFMQFGDKNVPLKIELTLKSEPPHHEFYDDSDVEIHYERKPTITVKSEIYMLYH